VLSAAVAVGTGEMVASFVRPAASPIIVVGNRLVLLTPEPVKRWAIHTFGTHDKAALLTGIYLGIVVFAAVVGVIAYRRQAAGLCAFVLCGAIGVYCALTTHAHQGTDVIPSILGSLAGVVSLAFLARAAAPAEHRLLSAAGGPTARPGMTAIADRRRFLQASGVAASVAVVGGVGGRALQRDRFDATAARAAVVLPTPSGSAPPVPAGYDLGKSGVPFVVPATHFYRIDTALSVPQIDPKTWSLRIHGMVDHELTLSYAELLARPQIERYITLCCVSNEVGGDLVGNALFQGVRLADLLREAGVADGADQLIASSSDGMTIGTPTAVVLDGRDAILAVGMNGAPLPTEHGFPVRMVVPGLYGYVSACKWIVDLKATTFAAQQAYWVQGGWAERGPVRLQSRIDRPSPSATVGVGSTVAIAGVAWDQHVGVSKVEVQIDDQPWQQATLAPVPSTDTWRQWLLPWTVRGAGVHTLRVRATDAAGMVQTAAQTDPFPAGATGWHTVSVRAR
jgi:DMSO/TMAO reductase YedYZ molybdopterin-dependent catalytic subunit